MRRWILTCSLLLAAAGLAASCGSDLDQGEDQVEGSGELVQTTREIGDFAVVELAGEGHVALGAAPDGVIEIETDDNLLDLIQTDVSDGRLLIRTEQDIDIEPSAGIEYRLGCPELSSATIRGAGTIEVGECTTDGDLELAIFGAGTITTEEVAVGSLGVEIFGAGDVVTSGSADSLEVDIPGAGRFQGGDLETADVNVEIRGDGSAVVWVTDTLDVTVQGVGDVAYYGNPAVSQEVTGVGSIESLGDR